MTITIQMDTFVIIGLTIVLVGVFKLISLKIAKQDPLQPTPAWLTLLEWLVESLDNMAVSNVGHHYAKLMCPYLISITIYIFTSNILGLFSIPSPTANYSVTLTLAAFTWVFQQYAAIKHGGWGGYLHGFLEPIPVFLPMNIIGKFSSLVSMSLRLFGNILAGGVMMSLIYAFTDVVSNILIPFNFVGPIVAPVFHAYFDVFSGFIQTLIFITLTVVLVGNELPDDVKE